MDLRNTSISHGTLRAEDLIPAFLAELNRRMQDSNGTPQCYARIIADITARIGESDAAYYASQDCQYDIAELMDCLDFMAPDGYYFGAHEADGSDFGYWQLPDISE